MQRCLALLLVFLQLVVTSTQLAAQALDSSPPAIELEAVEFGTAGELQVFTAQVTDAGGLAGVTLYFRFSDSIAFSTLPMLPLSNSDFYSASIETYPDETRAIEYYVQALDQAGNRVVRGFAFDPLVRQIRAARNVPAPSGTGPSATSQPGATGGGLKTWQIVLGVLAAGAIAGLAASQSGSDSGSGAGPATVPLTVTIDEPN